MTRGELEELRSLLRAFAAERDWEQFHTPKNLAITGPPNLAAMGLGTWPGLPARYRRRNGSLV